MSARTTDHGPRNVCFVHIEKAGGTTLHDFFLQNIPGYWVMPPQAIEYGWRYNAAYLGRLRRFLRFRSVGGHQLAAFEQYGTILENPLYVSFVRDPVDRFLSHVNWRSKGRETNLDQFLMNERTLNAQCMRICGQRQFEAAKAVVESHPYFIGTTEDYDESLFLLQKVLGIQHAPYQSSNVTRARDRKVKSANLDQAVYEKVRDANAEDVKLYKWVLEELFPQQKQQADWSDEEFSEFCAKTLSFRRGPGFSLSKKFKSAVCRFATRIVRPD